MRFVSRHRWGFGYGRGGILVLLVMVGLVLAGGMVRDYRNRAWKGIGRFSVLDLEARVLKSVDPVTGEGVKLVLPSELVINTLDGRGKWSVEAIGRKKASYGINWAVESIGDYLGVMGVVGWEELTIFDKVRWWWWNRSARYRDIWLDRTAFVVGGKAVDEAEVLGLGARWEVSAREYFVSFELANEELSLRVVNTTQAPGLAGRVARMLNVAGILVDRVESEGGRKVDGCLLVVARNKASSKTVSFIQAVWGCEVDDGGDNAVLYLGSTFAERYMQAD